MFGPRLYSPVRLVDEEEEEPCIARGDGVVFRSATTRAGWDAGGGDEQQGGEIMGTL